MLRSEFVKDLRHHRYEAGPAGLLLPRHKVVVGGLFEHVTRRHRLIHEALIAGDADRLARLRRWLAKLGRFDPGQFLLLDPAADHNLMVDQGLNSLLDVHYHGTTQITSWYIGLFKGNYTPQASDTAANIAANATEATEYDESNRVDWVEAAASSKAITNSANKATFTINATVTIYGAFLVSTNTKSGTSGSLSAASRFGSARSLVDDDQLLVTYTISAADA
jgi:hypothetical protein